MSQSGSKFICFNYPFTLPIFLIELALETNSVCRSRIKLIRNLYDSQWDHHEIQDFIQSYSLQLGIIHSVYYISSKRSLSSTKFQSVTPKNKPRNQKTTTLRWKTARPTTGNSQTLDFKTSKRDQYRTHHSQELVPPKIRKFYQRIKTISKQRTFNSITQKIEWNPIKNLIKIEPNSVPGEFFFPCISLSLYGEIPEYTMINKLYCNN